MEAVLKFGPVVISGLCLLFTIIGCAIPQISGTYMGFEVDVYLVKTKVADQTTDIGDYPCNDAKSAWQGAAAFAILSVFLSFLLLVLAIAGLLGKFSKKMVNIVVYAVLVIFSLIAWAIIAHNFHGTFCGQCYSDMGLKLAGGIALFILTTLLAVVGAILSFKKEDGGDAPSYQSV